jgi:cyclic dehypoxanthinyl futalosine synthase
MGISRQQALQYLASDDLIGIGMQADALRRKLHPEGVVSYLVDSVLPCTAQTVRNMAALGPQMDRALQAGATSLQLQNAAGTEAITDLATLEALLRGLRQGFSQLQLHGFSATEVVALAAANRLSPQQVLARLHAAGLDLLDGNDAAILDDTIRPALCCAAEDWLAVHRTAHQLGLPSVAGITFGLGESVELRVEHLEKIYALQQQTSGFTAFVPRNRQLNPARGERKLDEATAVEYLKMLAVSRLYLDNIEHVQTEWTAQGSKVMQMALRFGSNDVGSALPQELSPETSGQTEEDIRRIVRDAGFRPAQRDTAYRALFLS